MPRADAATLQSEHAPVDDAVNCMAFHTGDRRESQKT